MRNTVAAQLVGHEPHGFLSLTFQEFPKESSRRAPVPTGLDEEVDQVTVLVDRTPQILTLPLIVTKTSSRNHVSPSRPCRRFNRWA